jgi:hypothetical protein
MIRGGVCGEQVAVVEAIVFASNLSLSVWDRPMEMGPSA